MRLINFKRNYLYYNKNLQIINKNIITSNKT